MHPSPVSRLLLLLFVILAPALAALGAAPAPPQKASGGTVRPWTPAPPAKTVTGGAPVVSLLDEAGRLARAVTAAEAAGWKLELKRACRTRERRAQLHLWLGEWELDGNQEPARARWHFRQARQLQPVTTPVHGLARYDDAIAVYFQGAYREALAAFSQLLVAKHASPGYEARRVALWKQHAAACVGYHDARRKAGITEPERLDPFCGASSLAAVRRGLGLSFDRASVVRGLRVTGRGSNLQDLVAGATKMGLSARAITLDEAGLRAIPKPLVAFVERDHWIAVLKTGKAGVTYLCSECGPWPGGERTVTWKQWRMREAGPYVAAYRPGSTADRALGAALAAAPVGKGKRRAAAPGVRVASNTATAGLRLAIVGQLSTVTAALAGHVFAYPSFASVECGDRPDALHCNFYTCCPMDGECGEEEGGEKPTAIPGAVKFKHGPRSGDPVNLATGEEEYTPAPDLSVYNPSGPAVVWGRIYNTLRGFDETYPSDDFGLGWSHPYNIGIYDPSTPVNPQMVVGNTTFSYADGTDAPGASLTWDVVRNGSTVATDASPNSWTVSFQSLFGANLLYVTPPSGATSGMNYQVRYRYNSFGTAYYYSLVFDVLPVDTVPQGAPATFTASGTTGPASGLHWDVQLSGTTIATSERPRGWKVDFTYFTSTINLTPPALATVGSGYTVRCNEPGFFGGNGSYSFSVTGRRFNPRTGTKYIIWPNGSRTPFAASAIPDAGTPEVVCAAEAGAPLTVSWLYDSSDPLGKFAILNRDGTQYLLSTASKGVGGAAACHSLVEIVPAVGYSLLLNYSGLGDSGFPLLSTLARGDTSGTLLTFNRASDGSGNLLSVADCYTRSVYYHVDSYATSGMPYWWRQSIQELDEVSQIVTTGTSSPPLLYAYGYTQVSNGEPFQTLPNLHTITVPSPTGSGTATATLNYDGDGRISDIVDANGNQRVYTEVDSNHTLLTVKDSLGSTVYSRTIGFDSNMSLESVTDGGNSTAVVTHVYGDANNPYGPSDVTDGNSRSWQYTWDQYGNLQTGTTPRGTLTTYTWSYTAFPLGRLQSVQEGTKTPISYTYYEPSGLVDTLDTPTPGTSGGTTVTTSFTYNSLGSPLTITRPGNNAASTITTTFNYTTDGMYSQSAALNQPLTITDGLSHSVHLRYDSQGNPVSATDAVGNQVDTAYNLANQPIQLEYPATGQSGMGRSTTVNTYLYPDGPLMQVDIYDESATLIQQVQYAYGPEGEGLATTGSTEPTAQVYDAAYRLVELQDGWSNTTTYSYNTEGYLAQITYPGTDTVQFTAYDGEGNLTQRVDGRSVVTNYTYGDADGRLSAISYPAATALNVSLSYDSYARLTSMTDGSGNQSLSYDDLDAPTSVTTTYTGLAGKTISYGYYPDSSRETLTTPAGTSTYTYDATGRLTGLTNPFSESFSWQYLNNNWLWKQTLDNGVTTAYTYNQRGLPLEVESRDSGNNRLSWFGSQVFDGVGNRTSVTADLPGISGYNGTTDFTYNTKNELTQETSTRVGGYTNNFGYDGAGNPTTFKGVSHTYNTNNQDTGNTYDGNGNPTTYRGTSCAYDVENRLTSVGSLLTAGYRGDSLRAWSQPASGRTYFLYDGELPVVELDNTGAIKATNTFGAAGLLARRTSSTSVFYTFDQQGSVAQRLDNSGSALTSHAWNAHGEGQSTGAFTDPFGYGAQWGYYTDQATGLLLLTRRYYDPQAGRFLTRDPVGSRGGVNLYGYTGNDPVNKVDPAGLYGIHISFTPIALGGHHTDVFVTYNGKEYLFRAINKNGLLTFTSTGREYTDEDRRKDFFTFSWTLVGENGKDPTQLRAHLKCIADSLNASKPGYCLLPVEGSCGNSNSAARYLLETGLNTHLPNESFFVDQWKCKSNFRHLGTLWLPGWNEGTTKPKPFPPFNAKPDLGGSYFLY